VSLNLQAEGDVHWAVKYVAFDEPDPPVDVYFLEYDRDDNRFVREESLARLSVTDFAISYLLSYAHGKTGFGVDVEDCSKFIDEVRLQVASCSRFGGRWLIEDAGILATLEDGAGAFGISNSIEVRIHETATRVPACLQRLESSAHMSFERRD
jgi:hypothetical protein